MLKIFGVDIGESTGWDEIDCENHVFYEVEPTDEIKKILPTKFKCVKQFAYITVSYIYGEIYFNVDVDSDAPDFTLKANVTFTPKQ